MADREHSPTPRCLICLGDLLAATEEHIFPEAVGGTLVTQEVCKPCNDYLGSDVDAPVVGTFLVQIIRLCLGLEGKGAIPNPFKRGTLQTDPKQIVHVRLNTSGELVPVMVPRVERSGDKAIITVDASEKENLLKIANKVRERASLKPLTQEEVEAACDVQNLGQVHIEIPIVQDTFAHYRGLIKIAYELGARWLGSAFLDDGCAQLLRDCLRDRDYTGPDSAKYPIRGKICLANEMPELDFWAATEPRANLAFTQEADGRISCVVQLLGAFRACIVLSDDAGRYPGYEHMFYAEDPVTKNKRESTFIDECNRLDDAGDLGNILDKHENDTK